MIDDDVIYAVHAGHVRSRTDGDRHFVSAQRLARLYELRPGEWFAWTETSAQGRIWEDYRHLFPDFYGRYGRPEVSVP